MMTITALAVLVLHVSTAYSTSTGSATTRSARVHGPALQPTTDSGMKAMRFQGVPVCSDDNATAQNASTCNVCLACCSAEFGVTASACESCVAFNCTGDGAPQWPLAPHLMPAFHWSPPCLWLGGWHDVAGAMTRNGHHHVFMGCDSNLGGWAHAMSSDLVYWKQVWGGPRRVNETYAGMQSFVTPCSGFITTDDNGYACAGFRQCGSSRGVANASHSWDVPMEVRCEPSPWGDAGGSGHGDDDGLLTVWEGPEMLFNVSFYRAIPYDPSRPWIDDDGRWYMLLSTDVCNGTTDALPCKGGGSVELFSSPRLRGPDADWQHVTQMFASNATVLPNSHLTKEMVTIDYIGGLPGDPSGGHTRVLFNNVGGNGGGEGCCDGQTGYWLGTQQYPGAVFEPIARSSPSGGMVDWGSFSLKTNANVGSSTDTDPCFGITCLQIASRTWSMARTLGAEDNNYVAAVHSGRRVMVAWVSLGDTDPSCMSLARDLSLGPNFALQQRFVPELTQLRLPATHTVLSMGGESGSTVEAVMGSRFEIVARFNVPRQQVTEPFGVKILATDSGETTVSFDLSRGLVIVGGQLRSLRQHGVKDEGLDTTVNNELPRAAPLPAHFEELRLHLYCDTGIIELIVNEETAMTVIVSPPPAAVTQGSVSLFRPSQASSGDTLVNASADVWGLMGSAMGQST